MQQAETASSAVEQAIRNAEPRRAPRLVSGIGATVLPLGFVFVTEVVLGRSPGRWLLFLPAVFISAWWGGLRSGIAATLLSASLVWWRFIEPTHVLLKPVGSRYLVGLTFVVIGFVLSILIRRVRRNVAELADNRSFLQAILDFSPNGVAIKDLEGRYMIVNEGFGLLMGVTPEAAVHRTDAELFPCEFAAVFRANDKAVQQTCAPTLFETHVDTGGGRDLLISSYPLLRSGSGAVFATGATVTDVSQRKRGEAALREAMEDLRTAQHVAHVGSWRWDFRTNEAKWSEELYQIFGVDTSESAVPIVNPGLKLMTAESIDRLRAAIDKLRDDGVAYEVDLEFTRPDGAKRWCTARGEAIRDAEGKIVGINGTAADVTHIKDLERLRDEWTSIIAHDLRQPIGVIAMAADVLPELQQKVSEQELDLLRRIHSAADTLKRMVDDLLDMSLLEVNRLQLVRTEIDPCVLVRETADRISESTGAQVSIHEPDRRPSIVVDPMRIEQVLGNVLTNAVKYGEPSAPINVDLECDQNEFHIAVTNRGEGIVADELPHIFDRFMRSKKARGSATAGLGLGLYISKGIIEAHGGRMWAESAPGKTTTFHIALPVALPRLLAA